MRYFIIVIFTSLCFAVISQNRLWLSSGIETTIFTKDLEIEGSFNSRFYDHGRYDKLFPEFSAKYDIADWLSASMDYRWVFNQSRDSYERTRGHRMNFNTEPQVEFGRFQFETRLRVQYSFRRFGGSARYEPDFDNAFRVKTTLKYNIDNFKIDPQLESEWYYNINNGQDGKQFVKYRFAFGIDINLPDDHEISVKYRYDYEFNIGNPGRFHILSIGHKFEFDRDDYKTGM
tara:strand:- start:153522 stop:154214 length:693 start_codon:yes stop_codon:yes gene_type:complete